MTQLNDDQRVLAECYMPKLKSLIYRKISYNQNIYGFEYDDIFQEACLLLCRAALTYNTASTAGFVTYADKVITNGLMSYCGSLYNKHKKYCSLYDIPEITVERMSAELPCFENSSDHDIFMLLDTLKKEYRGTARRGIEALELKCLGYSGAEIADMHGVKPNMVGAWIARAVQKLKKDEMFTLWIKQLVETGAA